MQFTKKGFTLIELLVVISIISLLSSIVLTSLSASKKKANDSTRVQALKSFETALDLYYSEYGKYPGWNNSEGDYPGGSGSPCYQQRLVDSSGSCEEDVKSAGYFRYDNSGSVTNGFLKVLYDEGFIGKGDWNDPLDPRFAINGKYNCRYIVTRSERDANNVQKYALHCRTESQSYAAENDIGENPKLFEIQKPEKWLCIEDVYNIDTKEDCNPR
jgi:prepilin-type N-terminal cleavage/methylation domain-containing protein